MHKMQNCGLGRQSPVRQGRGGGKGKKIGEARMGKLLGLRSKLGGKDIGQKLGAGEGRGSKGDKGRRQGCDRVEARGRGGKGR